MSSDQRPTDEASWALVVHDDPYTHGAAVAAVRSALGLNINAAAGLRRQLPGVLRRGAQADLIPALQTLLRHGVWAELRPGREFPETRRAERTAGGAEAGEGLFIPLGEADMVPLTSHCLARRWTDPNFNVLPESDVARIRPLSPAKARLVWDTLGQLLDPKGQCLSPALFSEVHSTGAAGDPGEVRKWLSSHLPPRAGDVAVSWQPAEAVVTPAEVFCRYWDEFCYPGSDDVTVWSLNDDWAVLYDHEEHLSFGKRTVA